VFESTENPLNRAVLYDVFYAAKNAKKWGGGHSERLPILERKPCRHPPESPKGNRDNGFNIDGKRVPERELFFGRTAAHKQSNMQHCRFAN